MLIPPGLTFIAQVVIIRVVRHLIKLVEITSIIAEQNKKRCDVNDITQVEINE
jgi:hypothetical protein